MRNGVFVGLSISLFGCSAFVSRDVIKDDCSDLRKIAIQQFASGDFSFPENRTYTYPYYFEEAFYKLYGVKGHVPGDIDIVGMPASCYDRTIDSLIGAKFGGAAFEVAENYATNLHSLYPNRYDEYLPESPRYIPNNDSINADLRKNLSYPLTAKEDSIAGTVYVWIDVDSSGQIYSSSIRKGVRTDLDSAALSAVNKLGPFYPARRWGIAKASSTITPIKFVLE